MPAMETLTADLKLAVDLEETSDVVALPDGDFLVVSDVDASAARVAADGGATRRVPLAGLRDDESGLESVAYDASTQTLYVHVEEEAELHAYRWDGGDGAPEPLSRRELRLGKKRNKGVEGLVHVTAAQSPTGKPGLLLANEAKPRSIVFLPDGGADPIDIELDPEIGEICDDFSGLSFDPQGGTVLLVSDESATLVEIRLGLRAGRLVGELRGAFHLENVGGKALERVEGVCVDGSGAWWVLLENACELRRVRAPLA
jgi:uncharacterized protein YjiK